MRSLKWSPEQLQLLRDHYPDSQTAELVDLIGRDIGSIYRKAAQLGIKKSPEFNASPFSGRQAESPVGKEFMNKDGYVIRKVNNDLPLCQRWRYVHMIEWEQHHGPVPDGRILRFKDGNTINTDISNLELITRKDNLELNSIHRYPKEVIEIINLQKKLEHTIERMKDA